MTRILADLPDEEIKRLDRIAYEQGKSRAAVLRDAVASYQAQPSSHASGSGRATAFRSIRKIMIGSAGPNGRGRGMMIMRKCAPNRRTCSTPRMIASGKFIST
jgi:hypothetical protein